MWESARETTRARCIRGSRCRRCMPAFLLAPLLRRVPTVNQVLDALTLVLERRGRKALPAALLARAGEVGLARCQLLQLAVEGDLREVSSALDVDEHAFGPGLVPP